MEMANMAIPARYYRDQVTGTSHLEKIRSLTGLVPEEQTELGRRVIHVRSARGGSDAYSAYKVHGLQGQ